MHDPLRGVNLGGWLIMERWMTPTPFAGTTARDEYSFMSLPDAAERLEAHRKSWITEEDFRWMAENGLNAVRIPVGYWVLDGDAPYIAAGEYLDWAMEMAAKYELQVVLDVHGLPGSQNGLDHSGRIGKTEWYTDRRNRIKGLAAVEKIAWRYRDHPNLWGFQIINEPKMGLFNLKLRRYYHRAYARLSQVLRPSTRLIYSDAWTPRLLAGIWRRDGHAAVMDVHLYHMTTPMSRWRSLDWYYGKLRRRHRMLMRLSRRRPIIVGEWSGMVHGKHLLKIPQAGHQAIIDQHNAAQLELYQELPGWFYWSYKTEQPGVWNFRSLVEQGRFVPS
jgi:glucan 1,3-beta-glucosidase